VLQAESEMTKKVTSEPAKTPDPQVKPKTQRRSFTTTYKLSILEQAEECHSRGDVGALLRGEGLYLSHLSTWRELRRKGTLQTLTTKKRGPQPSLEPPQRRELEQLRQRNAKLGQAPATVVANLLDDGIYLCSARTMYRILCFKLTR
jgi:transposase